MRFRHSLGMALAGLMVFVLLPWSSSEAGRPVYLSDFFARGNEGNKWIYASTITQEYNFIEVVLTEVGDEGYKYYTYRKGDWDGISFTSDMEPALFLQCQIWEGTITVYDWVFDFPIIDIIADRQATDKPIFLDDINYPYVLYLDYHRQPLYDNEPHLKCFLLDPATLPDKGKITPPSESDFALGPNVPILEFPFVEDNGDTVKYRYLPTTAP